MVEISTYGRMRTCYWSGVRERVGRLMRTRSSGCLAQSSTTPCANTKSMLYGIGKNSHGQRMWQRQVPESSESHDHQSPRNGSCETWAPAKLERKRLSS